MMTAVARRYWFEAYLRTGRLVTLDGLEHKFNPNHDPDTGRFTFADDGTSGDGDGDRREENGKPKTTFKKVELTPEQYNQQASTLWSDMQGDPQVGFRNDKESNAGSVAAQQTLALSNADVEAPESVREAVTSIANSTRNAKLDGDQRFEKTLTFEQSSNGGVVVTLTGLVGPQGGSISGVTSKTIAIAHVHYNGMDQLPFKGDNSSVGAHNLPSFVIEGETGTVWEVGRQSGRYVQRTLGKHGKISKWQPF